MSKILISGGHLTPALAFIDWLREQHPDIEIIFVGREFAQIANQQPSWERSEIEARGLSFIPFEAQKTGSFNPFTYFTTVTAAREILTQNEITHFLSFGGYMAIPFALAARELHLPAITHEQTRVLGRANRALSLLTAATAISFPDTIHPFYTSNLHLTGNPLRASLWDESATCPSWFTPDTDKPILYIAGGSQGAQAINELILPILTPLTQDFNVVHQVGRASRTRDPLAEIHSYIGDHYVSLTHYFPREFLTLPELAYFYPRLEISVSRAGANTLAELTAFHVPTLYIPLPQANYHEQTLNAQSLVDQEAAFLAPQENLRPTDLLSRINELFAKRNDLRAHLRQIPTTRDACQKIYALLFAIENNPAPANAYQDKNERRAQVAAKLRSWLPSGETTTAAGPLGNNSDFSMPNLSPLQ